MGNKEREKIQTNRKTDKQTYRQNVMSCSAAEVQVSCQLFDRGIGVSQ